MRCGRWRCGGRGVGGEEGLGGWVGVGDGAEGTGWVGWEGHLAREGEGEVVRRGGEGEIGVLG